MELTHQHLIYQSEVNNVQLLKTSGLENIFEKFLYSLLKEINMSCLMPPQIKISHLNAWTGMVGIITSHIAFHYWVNEKYVQLDIYSCKKFDNKKAIDFISKFWQSTNVKAILINRKMEEDFKITKL